MGCVADPVFGRDISFFLFDLPFFRFAQSLFNGLLLASLARRRRPVSRRRRRRAARCSSPGSASTWRSSRACTSCRSPSATSSTSTSSSTARRAPRSAWRYTDANARFMAYDVLTFLSGLAGALLVAGAFTRWMWPLGAIVIIWFSASLVLGRLYPEAIQRLTVDPNEYAQEEQYIANNIAMTQLAFGARPMGATHLRRARRRSPRRRCATRRTRSPTRACGTTARWRRRWTSSRSSASTTTSSTWTRTATSSTATCAR